MSPNAPRLPRTARPGASAGSRRSGVRLRAAGLGVAVAVGLMGTLAACDSDDEVSSAKAGTSSPATSQGGSAPATDAKDAKDGKDGKGETKGGDSDKATTDLLAHLQKTANGSVVTEVRLAKTFSGSSDHEVTINTSLPPSSDDMSAEAARMDKAGKLAAEAKQWLQDNTSLKVGSITVLDRDKGTAGIELGADKDKNKDAADAYGEKLKTHLKGTAHGSLVTEVRLAKTFDDYEITINTTLPKDPSSDDFEAMGDRMDKADKLAAEAKQWVQDHPDVKVGSIEILDKEKGMAGIEVV